jgi:hypothetical protein
LRKFALIAIAGATLGLGATAPAALAGPEQFVFDVKTSSARGGTATRPRAQRLTTEFNLQGPAPTQQTQYATTRSVIHFDRRFRFNYRRFTRTCAVATVLNNPSSCPRQSRVGSGSGEALNYATPGQPSPLEMRAFQGPRQKLLIRVSTDFPAPVTGVIEGTISRSTAPYGFKLTARIPGPAEEARGYGNLVNPLGDITPTLTKFLLTTGATFRGRPYIQSTGCTARRWRFKADLTFNDGTRASDTDTVACRR